MKYLNTKPGSIEEVAANMSKYAAESEYQDMFKKELEKAGKGIGSMTPAEKKAFFNKIDSKYKAKNEETINEKKNYKRDSNFFVNDKTDTLKKMSGRQDYNKSTLTDYLAQKSNKKENDVYFDDTDLVYKSKTVLKNAETKTVDQMLKALQKEEVSQKEIDKFHTSLDKLVHKSFGHSSDEKKKEMKKETHSFVTNKQNEKQKKADGEKQVVDPEPKISEPKAKMSFKEAYRKVKKEAMNTIGDANADKANQVVSQKDDSNDPDIKKPKGKTDAGTKPSAVDTSPEVEYKN